VSLEVALLTPVLLLVVLGVVQFALWYNAEQLVVAAAQEAAAQGSAQAGGPAQATERAHQVLDGLSSETQGLTINVAPQGSDAVSVSITAQLNAILPGLGTLGLHATAVSHNEQPPS
jgi:Flp pilus assembly protein TadG